MKLDADDFTLFGLPATFALNRNQLDAQWKALQTQIHPDRFAAEGGAAHRLAMQWAVRVNEAYQRLKDPLKRAAYLCELQGVALQAETNTAMPAQFLMQQMAWRDELEQAQNPDSLEQLTSVVKAQRQQVLSALERLIDEEQNFSAAAEQVRALMFIDRFSEDIERKQDVLE